MQDTWMARKAEEIQGTVLNWPSTISDDAIDRPPHMETNGDLDLLPFLQEILRAAQQLSSRKSPGPELISVEIY
ncbi:unnamed protein product [Schistocephalus solidus]|uniref:Uncharacterized protein n=1 Tax=Schistocephalus solidus TaxID=70667 RepID=A0A183SXP3_SCHSO|nr:unnamed protein product [Schistocephalus solidus]